MNMNFMNFFALLFGAGPEDVGIPNPIVVGVSSEQIENGDIVISKVLASIITEEGAIEAEALESEVVALSMDTLENTISFNNLNLYDSTGTSIISIAGTISPAQWDLVAGVETDRYDRGMPDDELGESQHMYFYGDSSGMEVVVEVDDYYYEPQIDTNYFEWYAINDSLRIIFEPDEYGFVDSTIKLYNFER